MRFSRWPVLASASLFAGGASWVVKVGIIVATDGRIITTGPAALLMSAGIVLLLLGAAGVGAGLVRRGHAVARVGAAIGGVGVLMVGSVALGTAGSSLLRGYGPGYLAEEAGLLAAGLLWTAVGATALRSFRRPLAATAASA